MVWDEVERALLDEVKDQIQVERQGKYVRISPDPRNELRFFETDTLFLTPPTSTHPTPVAVKDVVTFMNFLYPKGYSAADVMTSHSKMEMTAGVVAYYAHRGGSVTVQPPRGVDVELLLSGERHVIMRIFNGYMMWRSERMTQNKREAEELGILVETGAPSDDGVVFDQKKPDRILPWIRIRKKLLKGTKDNMEDTRTDGSAVVTIKTKTLLGETLQLDFTDAANPTLRSANNTIVNQPVDMDDIAPYLNLLHTKGYPAAKFLTDHSIMEMLPAVIRWYPTTQLGEPGVPHVLCKSNKAVVLAIGQRERKLLTIESDYRVWLSHLVTDSRKTAVTLGYLPSHTGLRAAALCALERLVDGLSLQ